MTLWYSSIDMLPLERVRSSRGHMIQSALQWLEDSILTTSGNFSFRLTTTCRTARCRGLLFEIDLKKGVFNPIMYILRRRPTGIHHRHPYEGDYILVAWNALPLFG